MSAHTYAHNLGVEKKKKKSDALIWNFTFCPCLPCIGHQTHSLCCQLLRRHELLWVKGCPPASGQTKTNWKYCLKITKISLFFFFFLIRRKRERLFDYRGCFQVLLQGNVTHAFVCMHKIECAEVVRKCFYRGNWLTPRWRLQIQDMDVVVPASPRAVPL